MNPTQFLSFVIGPLFAISVIIITAYAGYTKERKAADAADAARETAETAETAKIAAEGVTAAKQEELRQLVIKNNELAAKNTELAQELKDAEPKKMELLQFVAAQIGNEKELKEIIELRARQLNVDRRVSETLFNEIIAQAPAKAADYRKMTETTEKLIQRRTNAYLLNWKPLFNYVLGEYDGMIAKLKASGYAVNGSNNSVPFTESPRNSSQLPRTAQLGNLRLNLQLNTAGIRVDSFDDAYFFLQLVDVPTNQLMLQPFELRISENGAVCDGKGFSVSANTSQELRDSVQKGMAKIFEQMLIVYEARK